MRSGCGAAKAGLLWKSSYRGAEYKTRLLPKLKLEIAVNEDFVMPTIEAIVSAGRTEPAGQVGDGKIFVLSLEECVRGFAHGEQVSARQYGP